MLRQSTGTRKMPSPLAKSSDTREKHYVCTSCERRFSRNEHLQRHIRRHTKEKPFHCVKCPKRFTRRDLLKRHETLSHSKDLENRQASKVYLELSQGFDMAQASTESPPSHVIGDLQRPSIDSPQSEQELLGNEAHVPFGIAVGNSDSEESEIQPHGLLDCPVSAIPNNHCATNGSQSQEVLGHSVLTEVADFMDEMGLTENWSMFDLMSSGGDLLSKGDLDIRGAGNSHAETLSEHTLPVYSVTSDEDVDEISVFVSRLPSLEPESRDEVWFRSTVNSDSDLRRQPWTVTQEDYVTIVEQLKGFEDLLPQFQLPSRQTISRLLSGYFGGFDEHIPFVHRPTFTVTDTIPELVLALCTTGAHYKFEENRCTDLFYAAKTVAMERIRRHDLCQMRRRSSRQHAPHSISVTGMNRDEYNGGLHALELPGNKFLSPMILQTLQAIIVLMAFASWQCSLVHEALSMQSIVARLVRELGLINKFIESPPAWKDWVQRETIKRTIFVAYAVFNQQTIAFDTPPLLYSEEIETFLPSNEKVWTAHSSAEWTRQYSKEHPGLQFQKVLVYLFNRASDAESPQVTPFGNYILIHALLQHIYRVRKACIPKTPNQNIQLSHETLQVVHWSLERWKELWNANSSSRRGLDPTNPNGPLEFSSTALLGMCYIRIHGDYGPLRHLHMQDPIITARSLLSAPAPSRSPQLIAALLHAVHALSIPVKCGLKFVSHTQTLFWSIQHAVCSMECAALLSKWLLSTSLSLMQKNIPLLKHEEVLIIRVHHIVQETEFTFTQKTPPGSLSPRNLVHDSKALAEMAVAVARIWATTFKGSSKWDIVDLIGKSLDIYANSLEEQYVQRL